MNDFQKALAFGDDGEVILKLRLKEKRWCVLTACDIATDTRKGPRLLAHPRNLIVPDLLIMKPGITYWVECKRKAHFVWFGITQKWRTGIDAKYYRDYLQVEEQTGVPVWLFFLHGESTPSAEDLARPGCPPVCPTGLFVAPLSQLKTCEATPNFNASMVYWDKDHLQFVASWEELQVYRPQQSNILEF